MKMRKTSKNVTKVLILKKSNKKFCFFISGLLVDVETKVSCFGDLSKVLLVEKVLLQNPTVAKHGIIPLKLLTLRVTKNL